jgi:hypothetical protein
VADVHHTFIVAQDELMIQQDWFKGFNQALTASGMLRNLPSSLIAA